MASGLSSNAADMAAELPNSLLAAATMSPAPDLATQEPSGWLGLFGKLIYFSLNLISTILYWVLRIATISIPSFLFTLFSTSWTITMNATTL